MPSPPRTPVTISVTSFDDRTVVAATGELDLAVAGSFQQRVSAAIATRPRSLILDLGAVTLCSAAILEVLLVTTRAATAAGIAWVIVSDRRVVRHAITVTGLDPALRPLSSLAAAGDRLAGEVQAADVLAARGASPCSRSMSSR